jgi:hypothetical protein
MLRQRQSTSKLHKGTHQASYNKNNVSQKAGHNSLAFVQYDQAPAERFTKYLEHRQRL